MKRTAILFIALVLCIASLSACAEKFEPLDRDIVASEDWRAYGNIFFYTCTEDYKSNFRYQDLDDLEEDGCPVYSDPVADPMESPLRGMRDYAVDHEATRKNGGIPVLAVLLRDSIVNADTGETVDGTKIVSFDTQTNKVEVIFDGIPGDSAHLLIYGGDIYFFTYGEEDHMNLHAVGKDGENYRKWENPGMEDFPWGQMFTLCFGYDGRIYFSDETQLFSVSEDLTDLRRELPLKYGHGQVHIYDGYIIYPKAATYGDFDYSNIDLCRSPVGDLSQCETLVEGLGYGRGYKDKYYFCKYAPTDTVITETMYGPIYGDGSYVLYEYSLKTGEIREVYNYNDPYIQTNYVFFNEDYLIYRHYDYSGDERIEKAILHNLKTGEEVPFTE